MKIGIFTVSIPNLTPEEAIRTAAEIGYNGLEWRVTGDAGDFEHPSFWSGNRTSMSEEELIRRAPALRTLAAQCGIEMPSLGTYLFCTQPEAVEKAMTAANAVGAKSLRVNAPPFQPDKAWADQLREARTAYEAVAELAGKYGVRALVETHMGLLTPTVVAARMLLEGLPPECTGIMWDPGNQVFEGLERCDMALSAAGEYLAEVHVKNGLRRILRIDEKGSALWENHSCPLPLGSVHWPSVIAELRKHGYDGWLMLEDFSTVQPEPDRLKSNFRYLASLL